VESEGAMKITISGRLGQTVKRGLTTVAVMQSRDVPLMPDGLPTPPSRVTAFTAFIAPRHWKTVENDPRAEYTLEGQCFYDADLRGIAVMVTGLKRREERRRQR
jgi:hypothetical protein